MSFLSIIETIGKDIIKGVEIAAPLAEKFGGFVPGVGPLIVEAGTVITNLEAKGVKMDANTLSAIIQALATASSVKAASTPIAVPNSPYSITVNSPSIIPPTGQ